MWGGFVGVREGGTPAPLFRKRRKRSAICGRPASIPLRDRSAIRQTHRTNAPNLKESVVQGSVVLIDHLVVVKRIYRFSYFTFYVSKPAWQPHIEMLGTNVSSVSVYI
jgi:hypothetical protein